MRVLVFVSTWTCVIKNNLSWKHVTSSAKSQGCQFIEHFRALYMNTSVIQSQSQVSYQHAQYQQYADLCKCNSHVIQHNHLQTLLEDLYNDSC